MTRSPDPDDLGVGPEPTWWRRWQRRMLAGAELTPLRIALAYTIVGFSALIATDVLLTEYVTDPLLSRIQALKGIVEVVLTAVLILALTSGREVQMQRAVACLNQQKARL